MSGYFEKNGAEIGSVGMWFGKQSKHGYEAMGWQPWMHMARTGDNGETMHTRD